MTLIDIEFTIGICIDDGKEYSLYFFYTNGIWDEDKLSNEEALIKYPTTKYNWIFIPGDDI